MKNLLITTLFFGVWFSLNAQNEKRFEFKPTQFGGMMITPTFDQSKGIGNQGFASWLDMNYSTELFDSILKNVFSDEKLKLLHVGSCFMVSFNTQGEVINCKFALEKRDTGVISEDELYNLYIKFKKTKIDMTKVKIDAGNNPTTVKSFDFTEVVGSFVPMEYRKQIQRVK